MITWLDESGTVHYSTFGYDPGAAEPYWVRYTGLDGETRTKSFRLRPWQEKAGENWEGFKEYSDWHDQLAAEQKRFEAAAKGRVAAAQDQAPETVRP